MTCLYISTAYYILMVSLVQYDYILLSCLYYYCINNMTCLRHVCNLVTGPDNLSAIMLHEYLLLYLVHVTLSVVAYYACSALHLFCFLYTLQTSLLHAQHSIVVILHMPTCMFILHLPTCRFTCITSSPDNIIYDIT